MYKKPSITFMVQNLKDRVFPKICCTYFTGFGIKFKTVYLVQT